MVVNDRLRRVVAVVDVLVSSGIALSICLLPPPPRVNDKLATSTTLWLVSLSSLAAAVVVVGRFSAYSVDLPVVT